MSSGPPRGLLVVNATTPAVLVLPGPVTRDEVPGLCDDVRARLEATGARVIVCDVAGLGPPGLTTVDVLARLELAARRAGGRIRLRNADPALRALLDLVGLRFESVDAADAIYAFDAFEAGDSTGFVESEGESEEREPAGGVQEAVEPGDAPL
ncbi:STAS domain-containing protein [Streptomyces sp. NPDC001530]|uniref:STAS domain-containing protein n=1 Tax=Streptomyces sp. NPDC001530 TaxID=3364582 RepID=UPI0036C61B52